MLAGRFDAFVAVNMEAEFILTVTLKSCGFKKL